MNVTVPVVGACDRSTVRATTDTANRQQRLHELAEHSSRAVVLVFDQTLRMALSEHRHAIIFESYILEPHRRQLGN